MGIGLRLKEERKRLDMSQAAFAEACGSGKRQQTRYEQEEQVPGGEYLAGAVSLGVDVVYVLTGASTGAIDPKELTLLAAYRGASEELQRAALSVLGVRTAASTRDSAKTKVTIKDSEIGQNISTTGKVKMDDFTIKMPSRRK